MKIYELFSLTEKESVISVLIKEKIDEDLYQYRQDLKEHKILFYKLMYDKINDMALLLSSEKINNFNDFVIVMKVKDTIDKDKENYESIFVKKNEINKELLYKKDFNFNSVSDFNNKYGLIFEAWNKVLQMNICPKSLEDFSIEEILCEIIYQLTFFGDENSTKIELDNLIESIEYYEKNKEIIKTYSMEEVFDNLNIKYNLSEDKKDKKAYTKKEIKEIYTTNRIKENEYILSIFN